MGFCFLDLASNYEPPESLVKWLEAGEKPIYIGFGSLVSLISYFSHQFSYSPAIVSLHIEAEDYFFNSLVVNFTPEVVSENFHCMLG